MEQGIISTFYSLNNYISKWHDSETDSGVWGIYDINHDKRP